MLEAAHANVAAAGLPNVTFHHAPAEALPLGGNSADVVIVNGIFNLCPIKEQAMNEVYRVLRPGGRLLVSEIVLRDEDGQGRTAATCGLTLEDWFQ